jgi:hypothetical protein
MIMGQPARIKALRQKMLTDCDAIIGAHPAGYGK